MSADQRAWRVLKSPTIRAYRRMSSVFLIVITSKSSRGASLVLSRGPSSSPGRLRPPPRPRARPRVAKKGGQSGYSNLVLPP